MANAFSRTGVAMQRNEDGSYTSIADQLAREAFWSGGQKGFRLDPVGVQRLNNPSVPVTQTPANLPAGTYCLWMEGPGTTTLSGGPVGVASAGSPVVFVLGGATAVTFTVAGTDASSRFQCEAGKAPTSFIDGGVAPTTRNAERLAIDIPTTVVQDMTFYARLRELSEPVSSGQRIFHLGATVGTGPYWAGINATATNNLAGRLLDGAAVQQNTPAVPSFAFTDEIEVRYWIDFLAGKHFVTLTKNGGVESAPAASPTFAMPANFSAAVLNIGSMDLAAGIGMTVMSLRLLGGINDLATMREVAGPLSMAVLRPRRRSRIAALISY